MRQVSQCQKLGFGIAHARKRGVVGVVTAYVAVRNDQHPTVDELRWCPSHPDRLLGYQHALKPNGYTQYDKFVQEFEIPQ